MEFPDVGKHCSKPNCNKLDFLPIKCDVCSEIFCAEHHFYANHDCQNAYRKNNQVPVCPLCNKPIPVGPGQEADRIVGAHIDNDCQSDPAINKRKVFTNKCSLKGCKVREVIPVLCQDCTLNYCLKHRHPQDHRCEGKQDRGRSKILNAAMNRQNKKPAGVIDTRKVHGNLSEDEALARALALSLQEEGSMTQEELDLALAKQLQDSEYRARAGTTGASSSNSTQTRDRCVVA